MSHTTVDSNKNNEIAFELGVANFLDDGEKLTFPPVNLRKIGLSIAEGSMEIQTGDAKLIGDTLVISNGTKLDIPNGAKAIEENRKQAAKSERMVHSKATATKGMGRDD